jgi:hypothetical protein
MTLELVRFAEHPNRIAATKAGAFVEDGIFFLDFTRPLEEVKKYRLLVQGLLVPVVHQGEQDGEYVISVGRGDAQFDQVRALWKANYPGPTTLPATPADGMQIVADFANQFPEDCQ